jgi:hypothetical protein
MYGLFVIMAIAKRSFLLMLPFWCLLISYFCPPIYRKSMENKNDKPQGKNQDKAREPKKKHTKKGFQRPLFTTCRPK